ncbi:hypothetical protein [Polaromonas sp.]|uniref:hypothetical protein n=1 Tax=Polaromonas sp. TaxID=1869339 RepID=UPI00272FA0FC|nr:hypothetical protein [Polaromonas sp.]MDP1740093.1 hypothetical protein [Polaromonas sp.]
MPYAQRLPRGAMKQPEDAATVELPLGLDAMGQPFTDWVTPAGWSSNDKKRIDPHWPFQLTIGTPEAAMAARRTYNPGTGFRERERLKRKANRWVAKLEKMPATERAFIRAALDTIDRTGEA